MNKKADVKNPIEWKTKKIEKQKIKKNQDEGRMLV